MNNGIFFMDQSPSHKIRV